jgi:putative ABC transport system permease protein
MFSFPALLLAAVGIYGVLSQRVAQRTQEIGMRVAPGARRDDLLKLIIGEGLRLTLIGIAVGIAGSLGFSRQDEPGKAVAGSGVELPHPP